MQQQLISLPTGKSHISYSEIKDWKECSFRHKLKHVDNIDLKEENEFGIFGTVIHEVCQKFIETRRMDKKIAIRYIIEEWDKNGFENLNEWIKDTEEILDVVPDFMNKNFPNWEYVKAEEKLDENIKELNIKFKGYLDAIIKIKEKNGKYIYYILDWKTCIHGWSQKKKKDFIIKSQLIYYKKFWSNKHNISLKDIKCGFILLKRKKEKRFKCELVLIPIGEKAIKKSDKIMFNMIYSLKNNIFIKNRTKCDYCDYKKTSFCPNLEI